MPKWVIFDMDGVIVDSEPLHMEAERKVFKKLGVEVSQEMHSTFVGISSQLMWQKIITHFKLDIDTRDLVELQQKNYTEILKSVVTLKPITGVTELLQSLINEGIKLAVASSSTHRQISFFLNRFGFENWFKIKVSSDDVTNGKPHPDIFQKTAVLAGVNPSDCLVIEDSKNGVEAALKAGMKCIGFQNPYSGNQDLSKADKTIHRFDSNTLPIILKMLK